MRALVQRVSEASVSVEGRVCGEIGPGLLVFLGIKNGDTETSAVKLSRKVGQLRVFSDTEGKMNRSLLETGGALLVVSQFTLYGDTAKGNRPSYIAAARPETAEALYGRFVSACRTLGVPVETGIFQAHMQIRLINDGPVTLLCEMDG